MSLVFFYVISISFLVVLYVLSLYPVFDLQTFYVTEMLNIICHHYGIKQIALHNLISIVLVVRASRISLIISSAERLSFHVPQKRLAHPLRDLCFSVLGETIELLSNEMSSNLTSLLKPLSSDQYLALIGELGVIILVSIPIFI